MAVKARRTFWQRVAGSVARRALKYAGIPLRDPALVRLFGRQDSASGIDVDEDTALNFSAVWSAISLISSTQAFLPCHMYKKQSVEGEPYDTSHQLYLLLNVSPNPHMTAYMFRETMQAYAASWGNAYARIMRDDTGRPYEIWPIHPDNVLVEYDEDTGELLYKVREPNEDEVILTPNDVLHIAGLGGDGVCGYSVISRAREGIGLGLAGEKYGATFFGEGAMPRLVVTHPEDVSDKARRNMRQSWKEMYSNRDNPHNIAILDEGMDVKAIGLPPEDSQFLQTRQFQVIEICRWFRVPPVMLYSMEGSTFNNTEQMNLHFLQYTMYPWLVRWTQEITRKLFTPADHAMYYCDFDVTFLLMADMATRFAAYGVARNGGWYSLNDINRRERLRLLPKEVGDTHLRPSTMTVLEKSDPSQPIPIETITALVVQLEAMSSKLKAPLPDMVCREIINAAIPSATSALVGQLVAWCKGAGIATSKPPPAEGR